MNEWSERLAAFSLACVLAGGLGIVVAMLLSPLSGLSSAVVQVATRLLGGGSWGLVVALALSICGL